MKNILISLAMLLCICGCSQKKETQLDRISTIETIDYETVLEKLESNVDFLLYIGRPDCSDCQKFYPILQEYVNRTQHGIYYFNIKEYKDQANSENASQQQKGAYEQMKKRLSFAWTPILQHYSNGKKIDEYLFLNESGRHEQDEHVNQEISEFEQWMDSKN